VSLIKIYVTNYIDELKLNKKLLDENNREDWIHLNKTIDFLKIDVLMKIDK
jgi:hypothetical protein